MSLPATPTQFTLADAREAVATKRISSKELTAAFVRAVEEARVLNAFVTETPERALDVAADSDARIAKGEGRPLEGLPLAIKDLFCTKGVRTTAGSRILSNFVPPYESTVSQNLWDAGAVMLGKTNMDEFAMGSSNETSYFKPVVNPWRARELQPAIGARWLLRRLGGRGFRISLSRCDGDRHGRLDPAACGGDRHRRHQADLWTVLALGHRRVRILARSGRSHDPHGARRGDPAQAYGERGPEGFRPAWMCPFPITRRRWRMA